MSLSAATTPGQSGPGSDVRERELPIPQGFSMTEPHHQIV